jgi:hypothetical protein
MWRTGTLHFRRRACALLRGSTLCTGEGRITVLGPLDKLRSLFWEGAGHSTPAPALAEPQDRRTWVTMSFSVEQQAALLNAAREDNLEVLERLLRLGGTTALVFVTDASGPSAGVDTNATDAQVSFVAFLHLRAHRVRWQQGFWSPLSRKWPSMRNVAHKCKGKRQRRPGCN